MAIGTPKTVLQPTQPLARLGKEQPRFVTHGNLGLLPSVTTINGMLSKAGLDTWKQQQVLLAALTLPRMEGESEQEWLLG
jgi:hypothetical protein